MEDAQIQGYVNGTLYVLLQLESIRNEAVEKYKMPDIIQNLLHKSQIQLKELESKYDGNIDLDGSCDVPDNEIGDCTIVIRQYNYILERLHHKGEPEFEDGHSKNGDLDYDDEE